MYRVRHKPGHCLVAAWSQLCIDRISCLPVQVVPWVGPSMSGMKVLLALLLIVVLLLLLH